MASEEPGGRVKCITIGPSQSCSPLVCGGAQKLSLFLTSPQSFSKDHPGPRNLGFLVYHLTRISTLETQGGCPLPSRPHREPGCAGAQLLLPGACAFHLWALHPSCLEISPWPVSSLRGLPGPSAPRSHPSLLSSSVLIPALHSFSFVQCLCFFLL